MTRSSRSAKASVSSKRRPKPRKAPQQARSRATVEALLTATTRILRREGYDRASTNRIAKEAGVSIGSLYQYFPSKDALMVALVQRLLEQRLALVQRSVEELAGRTLRESIAVFVRALVDAQWVNRPLQKLVVEQLPHVVGLKGLESFDRRAMVLLQSFLEAHRDEVRAEDLSMATFVIMHAVRGATIAAVLRPADEIDREALIREVTGLAERYLLC